MENNQEQNVMVSSLVAMDNGSANPKVNVDWAKNFGGNSTDEGFEVDTDKEGNIYVTGSFEDKVSFGDIELESNGSSDAFVVKLDKNGEVVWAEKLGGKSSDEAQSITVDEAGNSYVTGSFKNTAIFAAPIPVNEVEIKTVLAETEPITSENDTEDVSLISNPEETGISLNANGDEDIFIAKLDSSGKVKWAKNFGGDDIDNGEGITIDKLGNSYITGSFFGDITFGENSFTSDNSRNAYVAKLNDKGEVEWAKNFGGGSSDRGYSVAVDYSGNTYVTGSFEDTASFGEINLNSNGDAEDNEDIFITKIDETGTVEWAKNFGGTFDDRGYGVTVDKLGNTYITGHFKGSATFGDTTLKSNGSEDGFVAKLDTEGKLKWAKKFGGNADDESLGISLDEADNIYLTGSFQDTITFGDISLTSAGGKDTFIAKLDKMGMVKWAKQLGSSSPNEGFGIAVKGDSETYVTGTFEDIAEIDSETITSAGQKDAFLVKLAEEIPEISLAVTPLSITEDGDNKLTYTFTRTGASTDPLTVNFMVGGDAIFGEDYTQTGADSFTATEGMITFAAENKEATITVDAKDDKTVEKDETVKLTLVAAKNYQEDEEKETVDEKPEETTDENQEETIEETVEETEVKPEEVGKLMQSMVSDYKIATASAMATITNDDTIATTGDNSGDGSNSGGGSSSGGGSNPGGGVGKSLATKISKADKTFSLDGESAKIKFLLKKSTAGSVNEIALFKVDDEQGSINGVTPDDDNYAEVASQNATTVFSVLGKAPKGLATNLNRVIELDDGKYFRLLMVNDGTRDGLRNGSIGLSQVRLSNSLTVSDVSDGDFDLGFSEDGDSDQDITIQMQLDNDAVKPIGTSLQNQQQGEVIDLRSITTKQTATFTVNREAANDNDVVFYKIADADGGIDTNNDGEADVLPGDTDYITAAVNNRVDGINLRVANENTAVFTGEFEAGSLFAPMVIVDGTTEQLLDNNPDNDPVVLFPYTDANPNKLDHVRMLGDNIFAFEDLIENSDNDFNDIIVKVEFG